MRVLSISLMTLTEAAHVQIDSEAGEGWDWGGRISPSITNITTPHPLLAHSIIDYTIPPVTANQLILVSFIIQQDQPGSTACQHPPGPDQTYQLPALSSQLTQHNGLILSAFNAAGAGCWPGLFHLHSTLP